MNRINISIFIAFCLSCSKSTTNESENDSNETVITEEIKYNSHVKGIMKSYCTTCHSGSSPDAGLDLSTYNSVKKSIEKNLIERVNSVSSPMPPNGLMPLEKRKILKKWIDDGTKE